MGKLKHPFLTKLYSAFQDDYSLYMLIDLIEGCEVYEYLQSIEKRRLSHDTARFFSACMVDALAYVHSKSIIHRDIKAENIMITKSGYTKIIDFGFAKVIENKVCFSLENERFVSGLMSVCVVTRLLPFVGRLIILPLKCYYQKVCG